MLLVSGCTSIGDFGRLQSPLVTDDIHAWVGQEAAAHAGAPVSVNSLTDDERTLRDLAFPLIEPPYDRVRWNAVVYEYGQKRAFRRELMDVRHRRLLRSSDGRVPSLEHCAVQSADR